MHALAGRRTSALALALFSTAACFGAREDGETNGVEGAIVDVDATSAKQQSIGNCWLYATAAWAEALHAQVAGEALDLSESYWSYWHWYDQITGGDLSSSASNLPVPDGHWGVSAELIRRYGWMLEGDFVPEEEASLRSERQERALAAAKASFKTGALSTPAARANRALVVSELNKAWQLRPEVAAHLAAVFGADGRGRLDVGTSGSLAGRPIHAPEALSTGTVAGAGPDGAVISLRDVVGSLASGSAPRDGRRVGPHAWNEHRYQPGLDEASRPGYAAPAQVGGAPRS